MKITYIVSKVKSEKPIEYYIYIVMHHGLVVSLRLRTEGPGFNSHHGPDVVSLGKTLYLQFPHLTHVQKGYLVGS